MVVMVELLILAACINPRGVDFGLFGLLVLAQLVGAFLLTLFLTAPNQRRPPLP
jgi:hypothetical protein